MKSVSVETSSFLHRKGFRINLGRVKPIYQFVVNSVQKPKVSCNKFLTLLKERYPDAKTERTGTTTPVWSFTKEEIYELLVELFPERMSKIVGESSSEEMKAEMFFYYFKEYQDNIAQRR